MKTPAQVLREAAALVEEEGAWAQGTPECCEIPGDKVCAGIAIDRAAGGADASIPVRKALIASLGLSTHWFSIVEWNDAPERTAAEVAAAMRKAADNLEASVA